MTVSVLVNRQDPYSCDGVTILFALTLPYKNEEEITVTLKHKTTTDETELMLNSDFEIPVSPDPDAGNIRLIGDYATSPPDSNYELHIIRILPLSQQSQFDGLSSISAGIVTEAQFDKVIMIIQQLQDAINRAAIVKTTSGLSGIILPMEAGKYIKIDEDGEDLEAVDGEPPVSEWLSGAGVPSDEDGNNGDYYLNTSNGDVYKKAAGTWGSPIANLTGPAGPLSEIVEDTTPQLGGDLDAQSKKITAVKSLDYSDFSEVTIASGAVTLTQACHTIDTEADAGSDDLDTINGMTAGMSAYLRPENDARTVVLKHNTGNIWIPSGEDITLDDIRDCVHVIYDGTKVIVVGWVSSGGGSSLRTMLFPASCFETRIAAGWAEFAQIQGTNLDFGVLKFDKDTDEKAISIPFVMEGYDGGNITIKIGWRCNATTGNVIWVASFKGVADDEQWDDTLTDHAFAADGAGSDAYDLMMASLIVDPSELAADEATVMKITRDADNGSDTLAVDAELIFVQIEYTRS